MSERPERLSGSRFNPVTRKLFPWGPVDRVHEVGPYKIVEYRKNMSTTPARDYTDHGRTFYHPYVDSRDTCMSFESLDAALVGAIAYRHEGSNGSAGFYFMRMIGEA